MASGFSRAITLAAVGLTGGPNPAGCAGTHGMVALGLDKRVAPTDLPVRRAQIASIVTAIAKGLRH